MSKKDFCKHDYYVGCCTQCKIEELQSQNKTLAHNVEEKDMLLENATILNQQLQSVIKEFVAATPGSCWRKCWGCGKIQIHQDSVTPGVLCRFCGSQDTRLMKDKTEALKEVNK